MIKAIFFDFYNTLAHFYPTLDEIQKAVCQELGIETTTSGIRAGYAVADDYMSYQNAQTPLNTMSKEDRNNFFQEYERLVLEGTGLNVTPQLARQVWSIASRVPKDFKLFDEVPQILKILKEFDMTVGVISNLHQNMSDIHKKLGLDKYLDFTITSEEIGWEKPHPLIFEAALKRAGVESGQAIHVGDQYISDVLGAQKVGIKPILIDRGNFYPDIVDCKKIAALTELQYLVREIG